MGCILPRRKEQSCADVKHWTSYEEDDYNGHHFQMPLMCHVMYNVFKPQTGSKKSQTFPHCQVRTLKFRAVQEDLVRAGARVQQTPSPFPLYKPIQTQEAGPQNSIWLWCPHYFLQFSLLTVVTTSQLHYPRYKTHEHSLSCNGAKVKFGSSTPAAVWFITEAQYEGLKVNVLLVRSQGMIIQSTGSLE